MFNNSSKETHSPTFFGSVQERLSSLREQITSLILPAENPEHTAADAELVNAIKQDYFVALLETSSERFKEAFLCKSLKLILDQHIQMKETESNYQVFIASVKKAWDELNLIQKIQFKNHFKKASSKDIASPIENLLLDLEFFAQRQSESHEFIVEVCSKLKNAAAEVMTYCELFTEKEPGTPSRAEFRVISSADYAVNSVIIAKVFSEVANYDGIHNPLAFLNPNRR